ncbi:hypothetical protein HDF08_002505 [Edaphobacter lichenicola]|uniref:DUF4174 domain-containing protein n=1 Tax=Tunturiibacter lichenicola TaxID=2051959 RepID=A0A852VBZ6_9BACT|nr:hypothetical protein [Edaphobacter lichenicola]
MRFAAVMVLCLSCIMLQAQTLPQVHGTAVSGHAHVLPDELKGKVAVLIVGFTRGSSEPAGAWANRFRTDFSHNGELVVLRLPFLEDVPKLFRGLAKSGVERSAGQDRDEVIPIFESEAVFKQLVHYSTPDDAYILILDRAGGIQGLFSGDMATRYAGAKEQIGRLLLKRSVAPTP